MRNRGSYELSRGHALALRAGQLVPPVARGAAFEPLLSERAPVAALDGPCPIDAATFVTPLLALPK